MHKKGGPLIRSQDYTLVVRKYGDYIYSVAYKLCHDADEAADLAQETFLKGWEKYDNVRDHERMGKYLRKVCVNIFLMKRRRDKGIVVEPLPENSDYNVPPIADLSPAHDEEVIVDEFVRDLQNGCFFAMTRKLTLEQRTVFSLSDMFGLDISEIADIMEMNVGAVKSLLHRARVNINNFFGNHCEWVSMENSCKCSAWIKFVSERDTLVAEVKKREKKLDFSAYPEPKELSDVKKKRILSLYRNLADKKPDEIWYKNVIKNLNF